MTANETDNSITPQSRPRLPRGVKLKRDEVRGQWTLLAPERIFRIDAPAAAILELCDGARTLDAIVDELAAKFAADRDVIARDVTAMLADLIEKRVVEA